MTTRVHVIATGGTISSHFDGAVWTNLTGAQLVADVTSLRGSAGLPDGVEVSVEDVTTGPSSSLGVDDMAAIVGRIRNCLLYTSDAADE